MILLSHRQGVVTESQRIAEGMSEDYYIVRSHETSNELGSLIDAGFSTDSARMAGFRYREGQWSFSRLAESEGTKPSYLPSC
jgi:hypothetical protein